MDSETRLPEDALLDWHLDRLSAEERTDVERRLADNPVLRAKSERLGKVLQPLDYWSVNSPPSNLADKVLSFVRSATAPELTTLTFPTARSRSRGWMPFRSIKEMVAAAACLALIVTAFVPGVSALRERSRRTLCANNLSSVFQGVSAYQASFGGALPFAGNLRGAAWLPDCGEKPYASNSRHVFLLVKHRFVDPKAFVCPSDRSGKPIDMELAARQVDFAALANNSYSTLNLAGASPNLRPSKAIAIISDPNPLFVNARFNSSMDPAKTNSLAHRGKGQTVLVLDGSARWMTTPVYGPQHDNLWVIENVERYTGIEAPESDDDVQLVPGYPATDPIIQQVRTK